jgi:hypothetical protein
MGRGIRGKQINEFRRELKLYGWHGIIARSEEEDNPLWVAYMEPLADEILTYKRIISPQCFEDQFQGQRWCIDQIFEQWGNIFREWRKNLSPQDKELYQAIIEKLRGYEVPTALALVYQTTFEYWGPELAKQRQKDIRLRDAELSEEEPFVMFRQPSFYLEDWSRGPYNYIPQKITKLESLDIKEESEAWAKELVQFPFYRTINIFALAVERWIENCDIRPWMRKGESEQDARLGWLGWIRMYDI